MEKLFSDSEVFQKSRPMKPTEQQLSDFYSKMAKEIIAENFSNSDEEDIVEDLKDLYPFNGNGYELAKELDRGRSSATYDFDPRFCEWLDDLSYEYKKVNDQNIKDWALAHKPQPKFEKGSEILIAETIHSGLKKGNRVFVTGIDPEMATYYIHENKDNNGGYVVAFEIIEQKCTVS